MAAPPRRPPPTPPWLRYILDRFTPTVRTIVVVMTVGYLVYALVPPLNGWMIAHLALGPGFYRGEIWQPLTSLVLNTSVMSLVWMMVTLWWTGVAIEQMRGPRFLVLLFAGVGAAGSLVASLLSLALGGDGLRGDGAGFAITALLVGFARVYGPRPISFFGVGSMRADYLTWILVVIRVFGHIDGRDVAGIVAELATIGMALVVCGRHLKLPDLWPRPRARWKHQVLDGGNRGGGPRRPTLN
ncbi:MAG TPA: rhomboid family intramembrane serine protease [Streptosporangiaceae bacterium]